MPDERDEPRISLNQLTEYLVSDASRRKRIIEQQKRPTSFQVSYYQPAQAAIQRFIANGLSNEDSLVSLIDRLYSRTPTSDFDENRNESNAEALASFLEFYEEIDLNELR
ncbi:MAG: hypothetical protein AB1442_18085, partial [Nitrospirota bacterium]